MADGVNGETDGAGRAPRDAAAEQDAAARRAIQSLSSAWTAVPEVDREAVWQRVARDLGPQRQRGLLPSLAMISRSFTRWSVRAAAAAIAVIVVFGAVAALGTMSGNGGTASAAVVQAVGDLSLLTISSLDDDRLSGEEVDGIDALVVRLLERIADDPRSLEKLDLDDLGLVAAAIDDVHDRLEVLEHAREGGDLSYALTSLSTASITVRGEREHREGRGDSDEREHDANEDRSAGLEAEDDGDLEEAEAGGVTAQSPVMVSPLPTVASSSDATSGDFEPEEGDVVAQTVAPVSPLSAVDPTPDAVSGDLEPEGDGLAEPGGGEDHLPLFDGVRSFAVGAAGAVLLAVDDDQLRLMAVEVAAGWRAEIEEENGSEVRVVFTFGDERLTFEAELEHGGVDVSMRWSERDDDDHDDDDDEDDRDDDAPDDDHAPDDE